MNKEQFYEYFKNMKPMKYYEADASLPKAQDMINNKNNEYFAMRKYDGEWSRVIIMEDDILIQSRSISKVTGTYGDKTALVPHLTEELKSRWPAGTVLLGELAFHDYETTSREVGAILRCKPPKAIERQKDKKIQLFVFDVLAYNYRNYVEEQVPFSERFIPYNEFQDTKNYFPAAGTNSDFMGLADWIWERGGEGIMIVRKDMLYAPGKRTSWLSLKVKKKLGELEALVVETIAPNRLYEGTELENWKYFVDANDNPADLTKMIDYTSLTPVTKPYYHGWVNGVVVEYQGRRIRVSSGMNDLHRASLALDEPQQLIKEGKVFAKITGMELTEDSIRHPILLEIEIKK